MNKIIITLAAVFALLPYHATARALTLDIPNTTYDAPFNINVGNGRGNLVVVIRCDSSNGTHQDTFITPVNWPNGFAVPPWPAPGELRGVETDDTGMLCVAAVGVQRGNGFFQERASDCFYVSVNGTVPEPDQCFI